MMKKKYVLSFDQSTQGTKAVILDRRGRLLARTDMPHRQIVTEKGWISHDPVEIFRNVILTGKQVIEKAGVDKEQIACIGLTNQRETAVAWDRKTGKPVADANVWQCGRSRDICKEIERMAGLPEKIRCTTGIPLSPYFPATKFAWFMRHVPAVQESADRGTLCLGTVDAWLLFKLTEGKVFRTEYANASRTQLLNLKTLEWDPEVCRCVGVLPEMLPEIMESDANFGETDLGGFLDRPVPIFGMLGDSHGALYGHNCKKAGDCKATYGTGTSVMMNIGEVPFFSRHGLATSIAWKAGGKLQYVLEGNINYTGGVITWLKDDLGLIRSSTETAALAQEANPDDTTHIVPAFSGLGAPWQESRAKAMIEGMQRFTGKKELVKAACECIAFQINDVLSAMQEDTGMKISTLCVDGGATKNPYIMQFQSDISNLRVRIPDAEELSVIGVSYLAGIRAGLYEEKKVSEVLSYTEYAQNMTARDREAKRNGWLKAIEIVSRQAGGS